MCPEDRLHRLQLFDLVARISVSAAVTPVFISRVVAPRERRLMALWPLGAQTQPRTESADLQED